MKDLLRLASILDCSGHFSLSDKLFRVAQNFNQGNGFSPTPAQMQYFSRLQNAYTFLNRQATILAQAEKQGRIDPAISVENMLVNNQQRQQILQQMSQIPGINEMPGHQQLLSATIEEQNILVERRALISSGNNNQGYNQTNNQNQEYNQGYNQNSNPANMPQDLSGTRVMDGSQYLNNPYTPKGVMDIRRLLVPTNFRNELSRYESGDNLLNSSNPTSFATSLFEFARRNRLNSSLVKAFDAYADAGATYNGQSIKNIPQLKNLYMYVRNNNKMFSQTEIAQLLSQAFTGPLG